MNSWIRYKARDGSIGFGLLENDKIRVHSGDMFDHPLATGATLARDEVTLLSPCQPGKIVALWNNFHALAQKLEKAAPSHPLFLIKPSTSVCGTHAEIRRPKTYGGKIVYEGELGIVIGKRCGNVAPGDVIACGTSLGVGSIKDGATVQVEIAGIGKLANTLTK